VQRAPSLSDRRRRLARALYVADPEDRPDWLDGRLLRPGQVAALFQVSRRTVADWARAGKLPSILTPGGHRRFRARDVKRLIASLSRRRPEEAAE
jgi:excisionase family DNA binding protein